MIFFYFQTIFQHNKYHTLNLSVSFSVSLIINIYLDTSIQAIFEFFERVKGGRFVSEQYILREIWKQDYCNNMPILW